MNEIKLGMSDGASVATKARRHEAAQRRALWTFVSRCLSGGTLFNTRSHHYPISHTPAFGLRIVQLGEQNGCTIGGASYGKGGRHTTK